MEEPRNNLDVMKDLVARFLVALSPLITEHLSVNAAVALIKASVSAYLTLQQGLDKESAASHLGMSPRWIYKQLERAGLLAEAQSPGRHEVLEYFRSEDPESRSVGDCARHLEAIGCDISGSDLVNLVEAYCRFGYLERDGHRYRWKESVLSIDLGRLEGLASRAAKLFPLAVAIFRRYLQGEAEVGHLHATLTWKAHQLMMEEIKAATRAAMDRAVVRSYVEAPTGFRGDDVNVDVLILGGTSKRKTRTKETTNADCLQRMARLADEPAEERPGRVSDEEDDVLLDWLYGKKKRE